MDQMVRDVVLRAVAHQDKYSKEDLRDMARRGGLASAAARRKRANNWIAPVIPQKPAQLQLLETHPTDD